MVKKVLKDVDPVSVGKVLAVVSAIIGFMAGIVITIVAVMSRGYMSMITNLPLSIQSMLPVNLMTQSSMMIVGMGLISIFVLPIIYAISGFISGIIGGFIYNIIAGLVGGIEITLEEKSEE